MVPFFQKLVICLMVSISFILIYNKDEQFSSRQACFFSVCLIFNLKVSTLKGGKAEHWV